MAEALHRNALAAGYRLLWYEIERVLGQGGFGITYLAHDTNLDQHVAIKEYLPVELAMREADDSVHPVSSDRDEHFRTGLDDFVREARTLAQFDHPNIVRVHSVFEANNTAYMVMRYEEGKSLADLLPRRATLDEARLAGILYPVLDGLRPVHEAGFIHRDIKPANIFVREDGSPVLLDFGSARQAIGEGARTLTSMVTPGYAPFEQYHGRRQSQGPWTDIYALGATAYRAIVGVPPLDAMDRSDGLLRRGADPLISATEAGADRYSPRLLAAVDRALAFSDEDRPRTIGAWKALLLPAAGETAPETEPVDRDDTLATVIGTAQDDPFTAAPPPAGDEAASPFPVIEFPEETDGDDGFRTALATAVDEDPSPLGDVDFLDETGEPRSVAAPGGGDPVTGSGPTGPTGVSAAPTEIPDDPPAEETPLVALLSSFVGEPGRAYYLDRFLAWSKAGKAPLVSWNPAGLYGPFWFLYRRMILWGLVVHPLAATAVWVAVVTACSALLYGGGDLPPVLAVLLLAVTLLFTPALYGNRVYYRHARRRIEGAGRRFRRDRERREWLAKKGGRSRLAPGVAIALLALLVLGGVEENRRRSGSGPPEAPPAENR